MVRKKLVIIGALVAVFLLGGFQVESHAGTVYKGNQVSSARMARISRIRQRRIQRRRARRIALVLARRAQQEQGPFTELSDVSSSTDVTETVTPGSGGTGSVGTGGGEVPEPAMWMGLAGCAAVMVGANRYRRRRT